MSRVWIILSLLPIYCAMATAVPPSTESHWLYKTDLNPKTWKELASRKINTVDDLEAYARRGATARNQPAVGAGTLREIDAFLNGRAESIPDATYARSIDGLSMSPRSKRTLNDAGIELVGQLILARRSSSKRKFSYWMATLEGMRRSNVIVDAVEEHVRSAPSTNATYLDEIGFPPRALSALEEYHGITTYQQLTREIAGLSAREFDAWLDRLSGVGSLTKSQIKRFVEDRQDDRSCDAVLRDTDS